MSEFLRRYARREGLDAGQDTSTSGEARSNSARAGQAAGSVFSALFTLGAGASEARALELQAGDELLGAEIEETEGQRQVTQIRRAALQADAARRVAFAASGVDLQSLSVQQIRREDDAYVQDALAQTAGRASRAGARRRVYARRLADRAAETFGGSVLSAGTQLASSFPTGG